MLAAIAASLTWSSQAVADGIDVSFPQCGSAIPPVAVDFAILGVNGGRPYVPANPCLAAQIAQFGPTVRFYANTANPGPLLSNFWPVNRVVPKPCATAAAPDPDTLDCAYDYGWYGAWDSYDKAVAAQTAAGVASSPVEWWLDVEDGSAGNDWRTDSARNVAVLRGAVDALESRGVARVGFYSSPDAWQRITGGTREFAGYASWLAGGQTRDIAVAKCGGDGLTGGGVALAQYFPFSGAAPIDGNVACPIVTTLPATASARAGTTQRIQLGVNVAQGAGHAVQLTSNFAGANGVALSPAGPWTPSLLVTVPPRTRTVDLYVRATRAGAFRVTTATTPVATTTVRVSAASATRVGPISGPRRVSRGQRGVLRVIARDRFGNRFTTGITWISSNPRVLSVTRRPARAARFVARQPGVAIVRARSGARTSPPLRIVVR